MPHKTTLILLIALLAFGCNVNTGTLEVSDASAETQVSVSHPTTTSIISPKPTSTEFNIPTPGTKPGEALDLPRLFYIADQVLYQQLESERIMISQLGAIGEILYSLQAGDNVIVLSTEGISQVDILTGKVIKTPISFEKPPIFGDLVRTSDPDVIVFSTALDSACSATGFGTTIGLYRISDHVVEIIYTSNEAYIKPLGATADLKFIYAVPLGCDPEFPVFWMISADTQEVAKEFFTWDTEPREYGWAYATLSPDAHFLAFSSSRFIDLSQPLARRLSVYNLEDLTVGRYDLPVPQSHINGGLLWSPLDQKIYILITSGEPGDADPEYSALWSFDVLSGKFDQVMDHTDPLYQLASISPDGRWLFLLGPTVIYIDLENGNQVEVIPVIDGMERYVY